MKFKLDENFGIRTLRLFQQAGHDIHTVRDEQLQGVSDQVLYEICCHEQRCLVTLDVDFANVLRFPPRESGGLVVIRVPGNPSLSLLEGLIRQFLTAVHQSPVSAQLWIVEAGRIRIHDSET
jgi:predicted nuclease of predicted toxin-antitoxin system